MVSPQLTTDTNRRQFQEYIRQRGYELYREMPWRQDTRGYYVLVSELMLQQTQVSRVLPKFTQFITLFPDEQTLARASLSEVLVVWQGLGYNRRARYLHEAARMIVERFEGIFPKTEAELLRLPGVGKNTAGAILAYTYNQPAIFVETNIRTVFLHHFFAGRRDISDAEIIGLVRQMIDRRHPREFYWALMDYGTHLKSQGLGVNAQSRQYKKQAKLAGSVRQMRGLIIKTLSQDGGDMTEELLREAVFADDRYEKALAGLVRDGLVEIRDTYIHLGS